MSVREDNSQEKPESCNSCDFKTEELKAYPNFFASKRPYTHKWLCILCASTLAGNAHEYPEQYDDKHVLQALCFIGNTILKAVRER